MKIPVFHDDQHGTAIISGAALLNAAELTGRSPHRHQDRRQRGRGSRRSPARAFTSRSASTRTTCMMCDSKGVIHTGRTGLNAIQARVRARDRQARTLADALRRRRHAARALGRRLVTPEMIMPAWPRTRSSSRSPTPSPRSPTTSARTARPDAIVATGRSDHDNQVNNVLGFPCIFRGALDVRATSITEEMKVAAARALAELARKDVPDGRQPGLRRWSSASAATTSSPSPSTRA